MGVDGVRVGARVEAVVVAGVRVRSGVRSMVGVGIAEGEVR